MMRMKSKGYKKGGKMKKYQAGTMVSPDERAVERGNAAMDRISEEGTTNMMESSTPTRPKAKPAQPGSKRPPKRPNAMDGRRKGDIKTEELLGGKTKAEINAAIDSGKNPKKKPPSKVTVSPPKSTGALAEFVKDAAKYGVLGGSAATAGKAAKKVLGMKAGGMMKKKGYAKGGEVDPRSMKPKARPKPMTKKQQRIVGARGAASQYDTGTRDTPASEPVLRQGAKDTAKRQLDSLMGGGAKKALGMKAGGMMKKGYKKGGKIRGYGLARGGKACKIR